MKNAAGFIVGKKQPTAGFAVKKEIEFTTEKEARLTVKNVPAYSE